MKKELKVIYEDIVKPTGAFIGGLITGAIAGLPVITYSYLRRDREDFSNQSFRRGTNTTICINAVYAAASFILLPVFLLSGQSKAALFTSMPILTNIGTEIIYGGYEILRYVKKKAGTLPESNKKQKKANKLEQEVISSKAKNIEKAIKHLEIKEDGSLGINRESNEEKKRIEYQEIIKQIPSKRITSIRENLEERLPYLKESEQLNPQGIKVYFEKFGLPIENYEDANLFYENLLEKEITR